MTYEPTLASLQTRPVPAWFREAKLGIFIHWGPASVPAWAPLTGEFQRIVARKGWRYWFAHNPYADWYANSYRIPGSPTREHHLQTYGPALQYEAFVHEFVRASAAWEPSSWAGLFRQAGARYVVLVSKHHDGFLLWPSQYPNPRRPDYRSPRDLVGELAEAVRGQGMRFGLYYSGGLDWTFNDRPIQDLLDLLLAIPQDTEYAQYVDSHWRELIARYRPDVLWNDIAYPAKADLLSLFADYYRAVPDGVVNDRFVQFNLGRLADPQRLSSRILRGVLRPLLPLLAAGLTRTGGQNKRIHADFRTPEYTTYKHSVPWKWEATRGLGYSFAYNRNETEEDLLSPTELVHLLVDIVSKNGNLLLNIGPMPDGTIPEIQRTRLEALGAWLARNGEAIYGTRPWVRAEGHIRGRLPVRFTQKGEHLYAIILGTPAGHEVILEGLLVVRETKVRLLGHEAPLLWRQEGRDLRVFLPGILPYAPAYAFQITPKPVLAY